PRGGGLAAQAGPPAHGPRARSRARARRERVRSVGGRPRRGLLARLDAPEGSGERPRVPREVSRTSMNDWFARARPGGGAALGLTSVALLVVAALAACTHPQGTDGTPSAAASPVGPAAALDPYPLIPLRKDLGEFLIEGGKAHGQPGIRA